MKKAILSVLALICTALAIGADTPLDGSYTETVGGYTWYYTVTSGVATITNTAESLKAHVNIPDELGGCPVAGIGEWVFYGNCDVVSVSFPSSLRSIGNGAFASCTALKYVRFLGNEDDVARGKYAFANTPYVDGWDVPFLDISDEGVVGLVWQRLYDDCGCLTNGCVEIPDGITFIKAHAFEDFNELEKVVIPASVRSVGDFAFAWCTNLDEVVLADATGTSCSRKAFCGTPWKLRTVGWNMPFVETPAYDSPLSLSYSLVTSSIPCAVTNGVLRIPEGVTNVPTKAFADVCDVKISTLVCPQSLREIAPEGLAACPALQWVELHSKDIGIASDALGTDETVLDRVVFLLKAGSEMLRGWKLVSAGSQPAPVPDEYAVEGNLAFQTGSGYVAYPLVSELKVGPGELSEFDFTVAEACGLTTVKAVIAGVSGASWSDFVVCPYQGNGYGEVSSCRCLTCPAIIDVEKTAAADADDYACYYLPQINMAYWGGWIPKSDYASEDAVADEFRQAGRFTSIISWIESTYDSGIRSAVVSGPESFTPSEFNTFIVENLSDGKALVELYTCDSAHGITCCGYACDETKQVTDAGYIRGLFIIDSDNDMNNNGGGDGAPNRITYCEVDESDPEDMPMIADIWGLQWDYLEGGWALQAQGGLRPDGKYTEEVDGVEWTFIVKNGEASIGGGAPRARAVDVDTAGGLVIPSVLGGCPVTAVGDYAFNECGKITSVQIPSSVKSIGIQAFASCDELGAADIPAGVTNICEGAFLGSGITSATIPEGIESLADSLFYCCDELNSVTLPSTLKNIGWGAFVSCHSLHSLDIPPTVTNFDYRAFSDCGFEGTFALPRDLVSMMPSSLEMCSAIEAYAVATGNVRYAASDGMLLDRWTQTLLKCPVPKRTAQVPEGVAVIGEAAFWGCTNLTSLVLPLSLVELGADSFASCEGLTVVNLPVGLAKIGDYAFQSCGKLSSVGLPEGLRFIGRNAFSGCSSLSALSVPESVTNIGAYAFCNCSSLHEMRIPRAGGVLRDNLLSGCYSLTNATVAAGVTYLGYEVFANCSRLQSVTFEGDAPQTIRTSIYMGTPSDLITIVNRGTSGWNGAGSTDLPAAWPVGDGYARGIRYAGLALHTVTFDLGGHGSHVGGGALVQSVTNGCAAVAPGVVADVGWKFSGWGRDFAHVTADVTVTAVYAQLPSWVMTEVVGGIEWTFTVSGDKASVGGASVRLPAVPTETAGTLKVPVSLGGYAVAGVGKSAFENCGKLGSVIVPEGVTTLGGGAFRACTGLNAVTLPSSLRSVGMFAFCGCRKLVEVELPEGVTTVGVQAFSCCGGLARVVLPASLSGIGSAAFEKCRALESVRFAGDVPEGLADSGLIGSSATIYYPSAYAASYERIVPEDQRGVSVGSLTTTLRAVSGGKDVEVSNAWIVTDLEKRYGMGKATKFIARYGSDLATSLFKTTGKVSPDGRQMTVLDDYIAGTDPTDASSRLKADVSVDANGIPHVTWTPDLNEGGQKAERVYRVLGATELNGSWSEVKDGEASDARFFKVIVEMP